MAAPIHASRASADVTIEVDGELISKPYISITLNLMARFGVQVRQEGWQRFVIPAESRYTSPGRIAIEGDASTASYFMALGAIGGGPIHILGAGSHSIQVAMAFAHVVPEIASQVVLHADSIEAHTPP